MSPFMSQIRNTTAKFAYVEDHVCHDGSSLDGEESLCILKYRILFNNSLHCMPFLPEIHITAFTAWPQYVIFNIHEQCGLPARPWQPPSWGALQRKNNRWIAEKKATFYSRARIATFLEVSNNIKQQCNRSKLHKQPTTQTAPHDGRRPRRESRNPVRYAVANGKTIDLATRLRVTRRLCRVTPGRPEPTLHRQTSPNPAERPTVRERDPIPKELEATRSRVNTSRDSAVSDRDFELQNSMNSFEDNQTFVVTASVVCTHYSSLSQSKTVNAVFFH